MTTNNLQQLRPPGGRTAVAPPPRRGPLGRIVAAAIALGLLGAVALTLGVLPGAPEHVTTGVALLAFAGGWTTLAVLSSTMTSSPQRWAFVPAAVLGVTGAGLILLAPGDETLRAAGYVWPPVMLALAVWMGVRLRAAMPSRARWLLYPVVVSLAVASVGGFVQTVVERTSGAGSPMPGQAFDVGGRRLHLQCTGSGAPTVVLENGLGGSSAGWARIVAATAPTTRVCAYDRAGQGWSDEAPQPQDSRAVAADLHRLLEVAGELGPYVLAGHSTGGVYAMTYAARYPEQVAGLVLLDSTSPRQFELMRDYPDQYALMRRMYGVAPSLIRLGAGHLVPGLSSSDLPGEAGEQAGAFAVSTRTWRTARDEVSVFPRAFQQAQTLTSLGDKPLVVVSASDTLAGTAGWATAQAELAALSTDSSARTVESSHAGLIGDAQPSRLAAAAITDAVDAVRSGTPVAAK